VERERSIHCEPHQCAATTLRQWTSRSRTSAFRRATSTAENASPAHPRDFERAGAVSDETARHGLGMLERETGFEPATLGLGRARRSESPRALASGARRGAA